MERERIEMLIKHHELIRDRYAGSDFACTQQEAIEVLRLALLAIDSERARRVGEAVLEAVRKHDEEHAGAFGIDAIADDIGHDTNYMPHVEGARILRAVAAAMREEGA